MPNILITSAGRRVSLIRYFKEGIKKYLGNAAKVFTTDLNPSLSSACRIADNSFKVGRFADPDYMDVLLKICKFNDVKLVIPTIDTELLLYAKFRDVFAKEGITLLVSDVALVQVFRDKRLTNNFFVENGFDLPRLLDKSNLSFPLFIKPVDGSSSVNTFKIEHKGQLSEAMLQNEKLMYMEYLGKEEYDEYTIDLYYNNSGVLKCAVPRLRIETRSGEINKGITRRNELVSFVNRNLKQLAGARGCLTLQVFFHRLNKTVFGIEVNPRFGGGYPLSHLAGANYVNWVIREYLLGEAIEEFDSWEENLLLLRHDAEMIVHDFDYQ